MQTKPVDGTESHGLMGAFLQWRGQDNHVFLLAEHPTLSELWVSQ
jgi:hypothetical protein